MADEKNERAVPAVIFGAADEPDKVFTVFRATPDYGAFGIGISAIGRSGHGYDYGESIKHEDVGEPFFALLFCKRGSVQALKAACDTILMQWEEGIT